MHYEQFLLSQLLRDSQLEKLEDTYDTLSYDVLWDLTFDIYKEFENSSEANYGFPLYEAINYFIASKVDWLVELYEGNI